MRRQQVPPAHAYGGAPASLASTYRLFPNSVHRNHHGGFMAGSCHFLPHTTDPERAELEACKRALLLAKEKGIERIYLETDCMGVVSKLKGEGLHRSA
jgi:ribonuclease HI